MIEFRKMTAASLTRAATVVILASALSGCLGTLGESSGGGGSGGGSAGSLGDSLRIAVLGNPQNNPTEFPTGPQREYTCPSVDIMDGAAAHRIGSASGVTHQASLTDVARECVISGNQVAMKIGVEGRMLLGANGKPGTYSVPVRIAIKRGDTVVVSRASRVSVTVPAGEASATFTHVEENLVMPVSDRDISDEYDVFVGFDASGGAADPRKGRRR
jgi:hypothetical protein